MGRHGWAGLVHVPTGVCWRRHGRPTRPATSSGWAQTAGAPRSPLCCTWRRWPRAPSPSSPRGCPCEVGLKATTACPPPAPGSVHPAISITLTGPSYRHPPPTIPLQLLVFLHPVSLLPWLPASLCSGSGLGGLPGHTLPSGVRSHAQGPSFSRLRYSWVLGVVASTGGSFIKTSPSPPYSLIPSPTWDR